MKKFNISKKILGTLGIIGAIFFMQSNIKKTSAINTMHHPISTKIIHSIQISNGGELTILRVHEPPSSPVTSGQVSRTSSPMVPPLIPNELFVNGTPKTSPNVSRQVSRSSSPQIFTYASNDSDFDFSNEVLNLFDEEPAIFSIDDLFYPNF